MSDELSNDDIDQRIADLYKAGMVMAAKALERERSFRAKRTG